MVGIAQRVPHNSTDGAIIKTLRWVLNGTYLNAFASMSACCSLVGTYSTSIRFDILSLQLSPHEEVAEKYMLTPREAQRVLDKSDRPLVILQDSDPTLHPWGYERYEVLRKTCLPSLPLPSAKYSASVVGVVAIPSVLLEYFTTAPPSLYSYTRYRTPIISLIGVDSVDVNLHIKPSRVRHDLDGCSPVPSRGVSALPCDRTHGIDYVHPRHVCYPHQNPHGLPVRVAPSRFAFLLVTLASFT